MRRCFVAAVACAWWLSWLPPAAGQQCEMPNMVIVLDRSGSMSGTKWTQAKNAIQVVLDNFGGNLRFGLDMFPSNNDCGAGYVQVDVGEGTATQIMSTLDATSANGMTPTAATLMALNQYRPLKDIDRRNFVMLVTDGCDTCAENHAQDPVTATQDLYANGIRTFVIGFGLGSGDCSDWQQILTDIASAGHTGAYHYADNQADLQQAMEDIINEALVEICDDRDNDCDGESDEDWPGKGELCTVTQGGCTAQGVLVCNPSGDGLVCNAQIQPTPEVCDGRDNDCDGVIDNGFPDLDADGYNQCSDCCDTGDEIMTGCEPATAPAIHPGATEVCNSHDDDCDGAIDESDPQLGAPCGACTPGEQPPCYTDEGACQPGGLLCIDGVLGCVGEIEPSEEVCDGVDNDCDGEIDENARPEICDDGIDNDCDGLVDAWDPDCGAACQPGEQEACGTSEGDCEMGVRTCDQNGQWGPCEGGVGPGEEVCDGRDNDCDGLTDEDAVPEICDDGIDNDCDGLADEHDPDCGECTPGERRPCGSDVGECRQGEQVCTAEGRWSMCAGGLGPLDEECDGRDNDCDGLTDEGDLCGMYDICLCGVCASPCSAGECPAGSLVCVNGWCVSDPCCGVGCPPGEECDASGWCVDRCETEGIQCPDGEDCRMGICVPADCFTPGYECDPDEICLEGACQPDPCAGVDCGPDAYCRDGVCEQVGCVDCGPGQVCEQGACVDGPCAGVPCEPGRVCIDGQCAADPCTGVYCPVGTMCLDGTCVGDPCAGIVCPDASRCLDGWCVEEDEQQPDGGTPSDGADGGQEQDGQGGGDRPGDKGGADAGPGDAGAGDSAGNGGDTSGCGCGTTRHHSCILLVLLVFLGIRRYGAIRRTTGRTGG